MDELKDFPVIIDIPVQWGHMDALMHVNNVIYFRWWESSRLSYGERVGLIREGDVKRITTVLARMECNFKHQLLYPDHVHIGARVKKIGNSSAQIEHRLVSEQLGCVAAEAISTVVVFDFNEQKPIRIPDEIRKTMAELQPGYEIEGL